MVPRVTVKKKRPKRKVPARKSSPAAPREEAAPPRPRETQAPDAPYMPYTPYASDPVPSVAARTREVLELIGVDNEAALAAIRELYHADVFFQDPIQTLHGRDAFVDMNRRLIARSRELAFQVHEVVEADDQLFIVWTMRLAPKAGPAMTFEGTTHARLAGGLIIHHRDYWDLLGGVMEAIPLVGSAYRALVAKLG
jgi:ketosteroid isomerase-like protein